MPSPFDIGLWHLCWLRYLDKLRVPLGLIAKSAPGEDEKQHGNDAKCDDIDPLPVPINNRRSPPCDNKVRGDEENKHTTASIAEPMGKRGDEYTAPRVIEDPGEDKRSGNRGEEETRVGGEAERSKQARKEHGQMPQAVQRAEDDGSQDGTVALLQPRQRKAAPAQFFRERRRQNDDHGLGEEHREQKRQLCQERKRQVHPKKDPIANQVYQEKAEHGDQVPPDAHPPLYTPAQQLSHACSARGGGGHDKRCQRRPGRGSEYKGDHQRDIWEPVGQDAKPIHVSGKHEGQEEGPGPRKGDDEVGQQGMPTDQTLE